jgi:hypothetical protein
MKGTMSLSNTNSCDKEGIIKFSRSCIFAYISNVVCVTLCCTFTDWMLCIVLQYLYCMSGLTCPVLTYVTWWMSKDTTTTLHPTFRVLHWFRYHKCKFVFTVTQMAQMNLAADELSTFLAGILKPTWWNLKYFDWTVLKHESSYSRHVHTSSSNKTIYTKVA